IGDRVSPGRFRGIVGRDRAHVGGVGRAGRTVSRPPPGGRIARGAPAVDTGRSGGTGDRVGPGRVPGIVGRDRAPRGGVGRAGRTGARPRGGGGIGRGAPAVEMGRSGGTGDRVGLGCFRGIVGWDRAHVGGVGRAGRTVSRPPRGGRNARVVRAVDTGRSG